MIRSFVSERRVALPSLAVLLVGAGIGSIAPASASGIFDAIPGLSPGAQTSLVAHYDGRTGVDTTGTTVNSWTPVDGAGDPLPTRIINSTPRGAGAADLITYEAASGTVQFDDTNIGSEGRYLAGVLNGVAGGGAFSVFWLGHYEADAPFASSGTYAYNIDSEITHQRDNSASAFRVELFDGSSSFSGDEITAFDGIDTVWSTVHDSASHEAFADGANLNVTGTPNHSVAADPSIIVGAFGGSGFDLVGDIKQLIIFNSALGSADRALVESYLAGIPEPSSLILAAMALAGVVVRSKR